MEKEQNMKIVVESIEEILATPVEDLRKDQVDFLEKVIEVDNHRKTSPIHTFFRSVFSIGSLILATRIFLLPFTALSVICGSCSVLATFIWAYLAHKSFNKADYAALRTNKWSFELFVEDGGVEKVKQKLEEYDVYTANKILESIKKLDSIITSCTNSTEASAEKTPKAILPNEENKTNENATSNDNENIL